MRSLSVAARFFHLIILTTLFAAPALAAPDIEQYASLPGAELAAISPNGRTIAMIQNAGGDNRMVAFYPVDGSKPSRVDIGSLKARDLRWAGDNHVLLTVSITHTFKKFYTYEFFRLLTINFTTGENHYLFGDDGSFDFTTGTPSVLHLLPDEPDNILVQFGDVYNVNLDTDRRKAVEKREYATQYFIVDSAANIRLRIDFVDEYDDKFFVMHRAPEQKYFKKIGEIPHKHGQDDPYFIFGMNRAGDKAYAIGRNSTDFEQLFEFELSGQLGKPVWSDRRYDLGAALVDPYLQDVTGVAYFADLLAQVFFDTELASVLAVLRKSLKGYDSVLIDSYSADRKMFLARAIRAGEPGEIYLFNRDKKELSFIASNYPALKREALGAIERFDYRTDDGLDIPGYLLTPPGKAKTGLPLVVLPHGGPGARDTMNFDWQAQYYAALGFAVYKPNFRGSTGYGVKFRDAGDREWGGKMQDDITGGVKALIAQGIADPTRICIVGASYGGYAALMGGAKTPELYKCIIASGAVTDIPDLFKFEEKYAGTNSDLVKNMRRTIGESWKDRDKMELISPAAQAKRFNAPVLLIHGKDDTVVPLKQSEDMASALKNAGKSVELIVLDGEDHWLSNGSTRKRFLEASGTFLQKYLGE